LLQGNRERPGHFDKIISYARSKCSFLIKLTLIEVLIKRMHKARFMCVCVCVFKSEGSVLHFACSDINPTEYFGVHESFMKLINNAGISIVISCHIYIFPKKPCFSILS